MAEISKEVREFLSRIGKKGGSRTSAKKKASSRKNADKAWRIRWKDKPQRKLWPPDPQP